MSEVDLAPLKPAIEKFIPLGRSGLLPALHEAQKIYGWLPEPVASEVAKTLRVPLADVHGVIEFYTLFYNEPIGRKAIRVCTDPACALKDADGLLKKLCKKHDVKPHQTHPKLDLTIEPSPCLGMCELAPAVWTMDNGRWTVGSGSKESDRPWSTVYGPIRELTKNCGSGTTSLKQYGEYKGLQKALTMQPKDVVEEIKSAGLVGRGGAAFPTGIKWEGAANAPGDQKYVICNADESEPGTFKDRILLLDDPHATIEGMCIAAYAIGAAKGYIYVRAEYPYIVPVLENALKEAKEAGYLNGLDIEIRVGAGAYICGEETALFESIEGKRGFPRIKPPFPTTHGVFGKPTVINNVETLCNVPLILEKGAAEYRKIGTEKSPGPKLFCVSGDVVKPGLYEVPFGVTLRELLDMAGGVANKKRLQSVLFGGAAGAFATAEHLDVKMTFEDLRAAGLPLGSGVVMVFDETRDMRDVLRRLGKFFAHESCGKCYPCQMGTQRQMEILDRIAEGKVQEGDWMRLQDVGWTMTDASICGLGQTAASAVLSAMKLWPALFTAGRDNPPFSSDQKEVAMSQIMQQPEEESTPSPQAPEPMETPPPSMPEPTPMPQPMTEEMPPAKPAPKPRKPRAKPKTTARKPAKKTKPAKKKVVKKAKPKAAKKPVRKPAAKKSTKAKAKKPASSRKTKSRRK